MVHSLGLMRPEVRSVVGLGGEGLAACGAHNLALVVLGVPLELHPDAVLVVVLEVIQRGFLPADRTLGCVAIHI